MASFESLPGVIEHADIWNPELCYLTAGDMEKTMATIETQLSHNHVSGWWWNHDLPMFEQLRFDPRYQSAYDEYERRIALQREAIEFKVTMPH